MTPRRSVTLVAVLALVIVAVDQLTKWWAVGALAGKVVAVLGSLLQLRLVFNAGAALSIGAGYTVVLTILAVVIVALIIRYAPRLTSRWWVIIAALVLGGALGNLADRLFRPPGFAVGHVVDFIDYGGLFVGNVADIAIVAGAVLVAIASVRGIEPIRPQTAAGPTNPAGAMAGESASETAGERVAASASADAGAANPAATAAETAGADAGVAPTQPPARP